jgi:aminopeptidase YwaD
MVWLLRRDEMDEFVERIVDHLRVLVEEIGERPGGSAANRSTIDYLTKVLDEAGWLVEQQWFDCPAWTDLGTELRANGRQLPAATNAFSAPCDVAAPLMAVGTLAELQQADLHGRAVLLYGDVAPAPLSPKSWFLLSEREAEIIALLEHGRPAVLVTAQRFGGGLERLIEDWEFTIPSATISAETARELLQNLPAEVHLHIASSRAAGRTANVLARSRPRKQRVVICAHHDTKFGTPGALDNASGCAVVLALAETMVAARYPFAIELVFFANEEYLPIGDDEYLLRQRDDGLGDILACINIDGVGLWNAPDSITAMSAGPEFEAALHQVAARYPQIIWTEPWPESNHSTFAWRGVPSVAFTSATRTALAHHPEDDLRWINPQRLAMLVEMISNILDLPGRVQTRSF